MDEHQRVLKNQMEEKQQRILKEKKVN